MAQLAYCYAYNRRASNPLQFHIVGLKGKCESEYLDFTYQGAWDVHMSTKPLTEVFAPEDMIYLTSDSPNDLKDIEEDKVYVIGGLLDHNSCPKLTLNLAEKAGIKHARLPIGEYMKLRTRTTLTINQVYEIILKYSESKSWEKAFFDVIPARKGIEKIGEDGTVAECEDEEMVGPSIDEIYGQNEEGGNVISTKSSPEKNEEESTN
uniref:SAM-dependent MTase TRM10-type domain-containing protein n=1 Tax=Rhabditophanes sp. KR3021 TaxID=114890 RepID=A0AC35UG85_9BILA